MARSDYIYITRDPDGRIVAAFTVKHELRSYLKGLDATDRLYFTVTRIRDGSVSDPRATLMSIAEITA